MKIRAFIFSVIFCIGTIVNGQDVQNSRATDLLKQGQTALAQKEYIKARYLFKQAYIAFAAQDDYTKAVQCGIQANSLFLRENLYKEAFELCWDMNMRITSGEQKLNKTFHDLRFLITKERLQMYIALKNPTQAKIQLDRLEDIAKSAKNDNINENLLYSKAFYFYSFGLNAQGDIYFKQLIARYKDKKDYETVNECYRNLISIAKKTNNTALMDQTYEKYMAWTDSAKILTAQNELNILKNKHDESLSIIQEKDNSLSTKQYIITGLCISIVILIAILVFAALVLLRFIANNRKLKQNISVANEHNELKTRFIQNISAQMEPTLDALSTTAGNLSKTVPEQSRRMTEQIDALKKFSNDIQELSSLENSLSEFYKMETINANTFCQAVMGKIKESVHPGVSTIVNAINMQVKTNPEQLERILLHLLNNAAIYTRSGNIMLDFKKRGAHTHQFIVTDNGPGIPAEQRENLFKPFTGIKDLTQGNGLGLPICSLIAMKMNGSLTLDTTYTKGCCFILELHV